MVPEANQVYVKIRRRSTAEPKIERETVERLLKEGIMAEPESPWAANIVFVKRQDGGLRCITDFGALNFRTVTDQHHLEVTKEKFDWLASKKIF